MEFPFKSRAVKIQVQKPNGGVHSEKKNTAAPSVYICLSIKCISQMKKFDGQWFALKKKLATKMWLAMVGA